MRRSILLVLVAALALAVGIDASASAAADGGAQAAAKKKAAKCKAKPKKKGKGAQVVAGAAAKKKAAKCKGKPKPKAPAQSLGDGHYEDDANSVRVTVSGGGKSVEVSFPTSCALFSTGTAPLRQSGDLVTAGEDKDIVVAGITGHLKWNLTVKPTLAYTFEAHLEVGECITSQPVRSGVLKKG